MRDFLRYAVGHPGDRNAAEAVADKNDVCELLGLDDVNKILHEGTNSDVLVQQVGPIPHTGVTWRVDNMALGTELFGHALPAPSTVPRAVGQDEGFRCSLAQSRARPAGKSTHRERKTSSGRFQQISAGPHCIPPSKSDRSRRPPNAAPRGFLPSM